MSEQEIIRCHCNRCGQQTKHTLLHQKRRSWSEWVEELSYVVDWSTTYLLLECCGCEDIVLKASNSMSGEPEWAEDHYYPPRVSRRRPDWIAALPREYWPLIDEVYSSLHAGNQTLAMMGARALLDIFITRKVGDCGNFKAGLDSLVKQNYLAPMDKPVIESAVDAGHAAAHRAYCPPPEVLSPVMDIVENLIQRDVIEKSARDVKKMTPERERHQENEKKGTP